MDKTRLKHTLALCVRLNPGKRAEYLKEHHVFRSIGEHCSFMPRKVPLYPNLIKLGDYVAVASNVSFTTHDGIQSVLGKNNDVIPEKYKNHKFTEGIGCIEIGSHVFISARCIIGYNVKIGDNVVITAGSVVTNDIPSNSVVRGNPAKVVCTLTQYLTLRATKKSIPQEYGHRQAQPIKQNLEDWLWEEFYQSREK